MSQFHVTDIESADIASEAVVHGIPITMTGIIGAHVRFFTGVVQSVEEDRKTTFPRWRITILDGK
jgi:hypothetical protein